MFYRLIVASIVGFWLCMATLLVRNQYFSGDGASLPVPVSYVIALMFRHEQPADLVPYSQNRRLDGFLHVQPKHLPRGEDGHSEPRNLLSGSGSFALTLPGTNVQRIALRGTAEVDARKQLDRVELTASLHEPKQTGPGLSLFVEGSPARDEWHYVIKQAGVVVREDSGPAAQLLAAADPRVPGLDFSTLAQVQRQQAAAVRFSAHRGSLKLNGETIDTYVISVQHGGTLESAVYFNQLGQILAVKTFAGYALYDEGLAP